MTATPNSVIEAFLQHTQRTPQKRCLRFAGRNYRYADLRLRSEAVAGALLRHGLEPGDRLALYMENSADFIACYLGAQRIGAVVVPVNVQYRQAELSHILSDAGVRVCFADPGLRPELERVRDRLPMLEAIVETGPSLEQFLAVGGPLSAKLPEPEDLAVIAYTSGTTGRSKGAMLLHRNIMANVRALIEAWHWTADDQLLLALPLFHVHGLMNGVHGTLVSGATMELRRRFEAQEVYELLQREPFTMFFGVPTMYTRLLAEATKHKEPPRPLRLFVSGSAPLSAQSAMDFERVFGQRILERYGMTETLMNLTNPYAGERRPGTVGMPFPGQQARIVDVHTRRPVGPEIIGEIEVRGPNVFEGYWQRPDATAESFSEDGWFRTGDLGSVSEDGYITITGRARELIISGGLNVYPREIEEVLQRYPGVTEVGIVGLPDPEYGERVVAAVVRQDQSLTAEALVAYCREQLASYKKPRQVYFVDALPRNALGKVQKHVLREQLLAQ